MFKAFFNLLTQKVFYLSVANTLGRILLSFVISFAFALLLAIISALFNGVGKVSTILASIMRAIPTMSIILLALIWLSTLNAPMLVAILVIFPLQFSGILNAIKNVDPRLIEMAKIYKVPVKKQIFNLYLPETAKDIFSTIRSTISLNVKLIIAAEVMAQTRDSMGLQMQQASMYLEMHVLFAWTIMAIILGLILEGIIILVQKLCEKGGVR
jgi:NitT/TauT family transport system permease protein